MHIQYFMIILIFAMASNFPQKSAQMKHVNPDKHGKLIHLSQLNKNSDHAEHIENVSQAKVDQTKHGKTLNSLFDHYGGVKRTHSTELESPRKKSYNFADQYGQKKSHNFADQYDTTDHHSHLYQMEPNSKNAQQDAHNKQQMPGEASSSTHNKLNDIHDWGEIVILDDNLFKNWDYNDSTYDDLQEFMSCPFAEIFQENDQLNPEFSLIEDLQQSSASQEECSGGNTNNEGVSEQLQEASIDHNGSSRVESTNSEQGADPIHNVSANEYREAISNPSSIQHLIREQEPDHIPSQQLEELEQLKTDHEIPSPNKPKGLHKSELDNIVAVQVQNTGQVESSLSKQPQESSPADYTPSRSQHQESKSTVSQKFKKVKELNQADSSVTKLAQKVKKDIAKKQIKLKETQKLKTVHAISEQFQQKGNSSEHKLPKAKSHGHSVPTKSHAFINPSYIAAQPLQALHPNKSLLLKQSMTLSTSAEQMVPNQLALNIPDFTLAKQKKALTKLKTNITKLVGSNPSDLHSPLYSQSPTTVLNPGTTPNSPMLFPQHHHHHHHRTSSNPNSPMTRRLSPVFNQMVRLSSSLHQHHNVAASAADPSTAVAETSSTISAAPPNTGLNSAKNGHAQITGMGSAETGQVSDQQPILLISPLCLDGTEIVPSPESQLNNTDIIPLTGVKVNSRGNKSMACGVSSQSLAHDSLARQFTVLPSATVPVIPQNEAEMNSIPRDGNQFIGRPHNDGGPTTTPHTLRTSTSNFSVNAAASRFTSPPITVTRDTVPQNNMTNAIGITVPYSQNNIINAIRNYQLTGRTPHNAVVPRHLLTHNNGDPSSSMGGGIGRAIHAKLLDEGQLTTELVKLAISATISSLMVGKTMASGNELATILKMNMACLILNKVNFNIAQVEEKARNSTFRPAIVETFLDIITKAIDRQNEKADYDGDETLSNANICMRIYANIYRIQTVPSSADGLKNFMKHSAKQLEHLLNEWHLRKAQPMFREETVQAFKHDYFLTHCVHLMR